MMFLEVGFYIYNLLRVCSANCLLSSILLCCTTFACSFNFWYLSALASLFFADSEFGLNDADIVLVSAEDDDAGLAVVRDAITRSIAPDLNISSFNLTKAPKLSVIGVLIPYLRPNATT